jgi:glucokinase
VVIGLPTRRLEFAGSEGGRLGAQRGACHDDRVAPAGQVIALDVGGTAVKAALVTPDGMPAAPPQRTPIDSGGQAEAVLDTLAGVVSGLAATAGAAAEGVAIAFPGPFDYERGVAGSHAGGKYAALAGRDLGAELRRRAGRPDLPLRFCNDAEAAIVAEALVGAGRRFGRLLGITLGAGLGACLVAGAGSVVERCGGLVPGELYREPFGGASADDAFSDRGLRARLAAAGAGTTDPAKARCPPALRAFAGFGDELGRFLAPHVAALGADGLVVGGGIAAAFGLFAPQLRVHTRVPVRAGELGTASGLIGAAAVLRGRAGRTVEAEPPAVGARG